MNILKIKLKMQKEGLSPQFISAAVSLADKDSRVVQQLDAWEAAQSAHERLRILELIDTLIIANCQTRRRTNEIFW